MTDAPAPEARRPSASPALLRLAGGCRYSAVAAHEAAAAVATPKPRARLRPAPASPVCGAVYGGAFPDADDPGPQPPPPPPPPSFRVETLLLADLSMLDLWYRRFSARALVCRRRGTVVSTVLAICNGVLATLSSVPFLQRGPADAGRASVAIAIAAAALGVVALVCQALARLCQWDAGAVQCQLAAQRCLGLRARVLVDLATGEDALAATLEFMQGEMRNIHQSEATGHLNGPLELEPPPGLGR